MKATVHHVVIEDLILRVKYLISDLFLVCRRCSLSSSLFVALHCNIVTNVPHNPDGWYMLAAVACCRLWMEHISGSLHH